MVKRPLKVNLGCGPSRIEGWVTWFRKLLIELNLLAKNYETKWPPLALVDIRRKLPLRDQSVDFIYCSHVLEHFEKWQSESILKECKRVLKKTGIIRVILPDLKLMIDQFNSAEEFCRQFYGYNKDQKRWYKIFVRGHQWMYDKKSIIKEIKKAGFGKVNVVGWRQGLVPDIDKLDLYEQRMISLYIEAKA
jgi:predicted SAM-dependent methyltransferase